MADLLTTETENAPRVVPTAEELRAEIAKRRIPQALLARMLKMGPTLLSKRLNERKGYKLAPDKALEILRHLEHLSSQHRETWYMPRGLSKSGQRKARAKSV